MDALTSTDGKSLLLASEWARARSRSSKTVGTKSLQNQSVPIIDMSGLLNAIAYNCNRLRCPCARDQINSERTGNGSRLRLIKSANNSSHRDHAARISACSKRDIQAKWRGMRYRQYGRLPPRIPGPQQRTRHEHTVQRFASSGQSGHGVSQHIILKSAKSIGHK